MASMSRPERISELHDKAVKELVHAHEQRTDEPLVLAVRYKADELEDVYLFEVLSGFPGGDDDEVLTTEFAPSAQLRILGELHLSLCSPAQLRTAVRRNDAIISDLRRGSVVSASGAEGAELRGLLGL